MTPSPRRRVQKAALATSPLPHTHTGECGGGHGCPPEKRGSALLPLHGKSSTASSPPPPGEDPTHRLRSSSGVNEAARAGIGTGKTESKEGGREVAGADFARTGEGGRRREGAERAWGRTIGAAEEGEKERKGRDFAVAIHEEEETTQLNGNLRKSGRRRALRRSYSNHTIVLYCGR